MGYTARFKVWRGDASGGDLTDFEVEVNEGEVVLDVIHRLQATQAGDLAVRWNCKAGKCGSCSAEINGRPRLMCMTRMSTFTEEETITVTPMRTFPVIRDLVTDVSYNYEVAARIPAFSPKPREADGTYRMQQLDVERSQEFRKCIECFLCNNTCHVIRDHEENKEHFAGPRFLMRIAELDMHPLDTVDRREVAQEEFGLGYCNITKCCTEVCPEGIHITDNALIPLKERVVDTRFDPVVWLGSTISRLRRVEAPEPVEFEEPAGVAALAEEPAAQSAYSRSKFWFLSGEDTCRGIVLKPQGQGPFPTVLMAHGLGTSSSARLEQFAEQFALAGYAAVMFDYRGFGESGGAPRNVVDPKAQRADYRAALERLRTLDWVDPEAIVLWGTSYAGGHVIAVAAEEPDVAAVIAQVPQASGLASTMAMRPRPGHANRLLMAAVRDKLGSLVGRPPRMLPVAGVPGSKAILTSPDALPGYQFLTRGEVPSIAARWALSAALDSPGKKASSVRAPLLVQVMHADEVTPAAPALKAARRAPRGVSRVYEGGHFDAYARRFDEVIADQLAFLAAHVPANQLTDA
ncbi:MAG: succinate dehydrogenase / fumarate reductase, iron-sulfur subunit [Frankiales bacterium]|nr:succinate dehydrogenase / fumarate reductase, iron-sulfur subunit [Frankiales bacterium]